VTLLTLELFPAFEFEDDDLRPAPVLDDGAGDARAVNRRRADAHPVVAARHEHVELDLIAFVLVGERGDSDHFAGRDAELFPARPDATVKYLQI
jgi:hypothetical protein